MRSPEGQEHPNIGCYLEIVQYEKLVFTDALGPGYRPVKNPFFTGIISVGPHGKGTKYTAIVIHKDEEDRKKHEQMGFFDGWSKALDQLVAVVKAM
jgi:uncharacterized protein YndB with AHSA1/START domain